MIDKITNKLRKCLVKEKLDEVHVVFLLSRIRKILEMSGRNNYTKLKFFCDWALHTEIENTDAVYEELIDFFVIGHESYLYKPFHTEMKKFLIENSIDTLIYKEMKNTLAFENILDEIYSDTPLFIRSKNIKITLKKGDLNQTMIGEIPVHVVGREFTVTPIKK